MSASVSELVGIVSLSGADSSIAQLEAMDAATAASDAALSTLATSSGDAGAALGVVAEAVAGFNTALGETDGSTAAATAAIEALNTALEEDSAVISALNEQITFLQGQLDALSISEDGAATSATGSAAALDTLKTSASGVTSTISLFGIIGVAALVAVAVKSTELSAKYQQMMNMEQALTGSSNAQMQSYDASLKQLAADAGVAPVELAKGLYQIISSGAQGKQAMLELTLATEDAKIGMVDAATTANALTNILATYSWQTKNAAQVNGIMLETVTLGKSTFEQYASSITKAATSASQFHISLQTMSAAWATLTANGISAAHASTDFQQVVQAMYGKVATITKALEKNGIAFNETAFNAADFRGKVLMLNSALQEAAAKHVQVTGVTLQAAQAIQIISQHVGMYNDDLSTLGNTQAMIQKTSAAWAITQSGFLQTMSRVGALVQVIAIDFSSLLLPALTNIVQAMLPVLGAFAQWMTGVQGSQHVMQILTPTLTGLAVLLAGLLIPTLFSLAGAVIAATWPLLLAAAAAAALVAAFMHFYQTSAAFRGAVNQVSGAVGHMASQIGQAFSVMHTQAEQQTLQTKLATTRNLLQMAQDNLATINRQRLQIEQEMSRTKDAVVRAALEAKLQSLNASAQQAQGVIANYQKQTRGIQAQLAALDQSVQLHNLQRKDSTISSTIAMTARTIAGYEQMKQGIEQQLAHTTDSTKRAALEQQLVQINAAERAKQGVLKQMEAQRKGVESQMRSLSQSIASQQSNPFLHIMHGVQQFGTTVSRVIQQQVLPVLQQIGGFLVSTFAPVWQQLVQTWQGQLVPAFQQMWQALQPALPLFQAIGVMIGVVVIGVLGILVGILTGVVKAFAGLLSGVITVFTGIVQIVTGAVTIIGGILSIFVDLCTGHFSKLGGDLHNIWNGIVLMFEGIWHVIEGIFQAAWGVISGLVSGFVQGIIGFFTHLWSALVGHSIIPDMVAGIIQWIQNLVSTVISAISGFVSQIIAFFLQLEVQVLSTITLMIQLALQFFSGWVSQGLTFISNLVSGVLSWMLQMEVRVLATVQLMVQIFLQWLDSLTGGAISKAQGVVAGITGVLGNLASLAVQWGQHLVQGFLSGVQSMFGAVGNIMGQLGNLIGSFLPHSPAKRGELAHLSEYGPSLVAGIASGIAGSYGMMGAAMSGLASHMSASWQSQAQSALAVAASAHLSVLSSSAGLAGVPAGVSVVPASVSGAQAPITVYVQQPDLQLDGARVTRQLMPHQTRWIRQTTGARI